MARRSPPRAGSIEAGRPLPGAIAGADAGMAELLVRLALDLHGQELTPLAATFARLATWLAPDNSEAWMVAAELLGQQDRQRIAVPLLANVGADDPFAATARDQRIRLLRRRRRPRGGARRGARRDAAAPAAEVADWVRLGEVYGALEPPGATPPTPSAGRWRCAATATTARPNGPCG